MPDAVTTSATAIVEAAPAKINLALHITGRRADGYHLLESLVVFSRFGDLVTVEAADADSFSVDGPFASSAPLDDSNLVLRARDALRSIRCKINPIAIRLAKNLPVASGVGGGSSDAAATLRALNRLWNANLTDAQLAAIGRTLGADVPMCLAAHPLVARGIGDQIERLDDVPALALVLVNPGVAVSTAEIFAALPDRDNAAMPPPPRVIDFHSLRNWLETTRNDLEPVARAMQPAIGQAIAALNKADSGFSRMSGSGATCFGLFETGNVAKRAAIEIRRRHPHWFVAATRTITSEAARYGSD